jgi:hypothetical protein
LANETWRRNSDGGGGGKVKIEARERRGRTLGEPAGVVPAKLRRRRDLRA